MKKAIAVATLALAVGASGFAQSTTDLKAFQSAFDSLAGGIASSIAVGATLSQDWSDAYIGSFPHLGVGITGGAVTTGASTYDYIASLASAAGYSIPSQYTQLLKSGLPIGTTAGSIKIGIPFLPIDIGVSGAYVPTSLTAALASATGISASYQSFGVQVRYAIVQQDLVLPNVSIGAAYNYQAGSLGASVGSAASYAVTANGQSYTISASAPELSLGWTSSTFDLTAQVSKQLLIAYPFLGAGLTVGQSTVKSGIASTLSTNYSGGISGLNQILSALGYPTLSDTGIWSEKSVTTPIFRVYGGVSLRLAVVDLGVTALYVPQTGAVGAAFTTRVQI